MPFFRLFYKKATLKAIPALQMGYSFKTRSFCEQLCLNFKHCIFWRHFYAYLYVQAPNLPLENEHDIARNTHNICPSWFKKRRFSGPFGWHYGFTISLIGVALWGRLGRLRDGRLARGGASPPFGACAGSLALGKRLHLYSLQGAKPIGWPKLHGMSKRMGRRS